MRILNVGDKFVVKIRKVEAGRDGKVYVTIGHPMFANSPSMILKLDQEATFEDRQELHNTMLWNGRC